MKRLVSRKQLEANRRNAKLSTGPKTIEGKQRIKFNALSHGFLSKSVLITAKEFPDDAADYGFLLGELRDDLMPVGALEEILVEKIAAAYWRLGRIVRAEASRMSSKCNQRSDEEISARVNDAIITKALIQSSESLDAESTELASNDPVITLLLFAKKETEAQGCINESLQGFIVRALKDDNERFVDAFALLCDLTRAKRENRSYSGKQYRHMEDSDESQKSLVELLERRIEKQKRSVESLSDTEQLESITWEMHMTLLSSETAEKYHRYETMYERQLYKAMDQLERLQRIRGRGTILPLISVDVRTAP